MTAVHGGGVGHLAVFFEVLDDEELYEVAGALDVLHTFALFKRGELEIDDVVMKPRVRILHLLDMLALVEGKETSVAEGRVIVRVKVWVARKEKVYRAAAIYGGYDDSDANFDVPLFLDVGDTSGRLKALQGTAAVRIQLAVVIVLQDDHKVNF